MVVTKIKQIHINRSKTRNKKNILKTPQFIVFYNILNKVLFVYRQSLSALSYLSHNKITFHSQPNKNKYINNIHISN